jgi:hypothetical protein
MMGTRNLLNVSFFRSSQSTSCWIGGVSGNTSSMTRVANAVRREMLRMASCSSPFQNHRAPSIRPCRPEDGSPSSGIVDDVEDVLDRLVALGRGCAVLLLVAFVVVCAIGVVVWVVRAVGGLFGG